MPLLELPHTSGCMVCGRENSYGLKLSLYVETATGLISAEFTPSPHHIGFQGIIHGGILALVLDEAMVWAATWAGRRFCICGELNLRYRQSGLVGVPLRVEAKIEALRSRLIEVTGSVLGADGTIYTTATGKYVPVPPAQNAKFVATLVDEPPVATTIKALQAGTLPAR